MKRLGSRLLWLALVVVVLFLALAMAPYVVPTRVALGPCGRDWTSASSYLPRASPTESITFKDDGFSMKVCYGSPSARGREVFGGLVSWGELWRMGANEPTRVFVDAAVDFGGVALPPGRYSIYAIPGRDEWRLMVSESTFHWGNAISTSVRAREVGSFAVEPEGLEQAVEALRFQWRSAGDGQPGSLEMQWAATRIAIPVRSASAH
jgi:hypothetical protein